MNMRARLSAYSTIGRSQSGVALVMALVILLILTIIGVAAMKTSFLEAKMSGNTQETTKAFQSAESGLKRAMNQAGAFDIHTVTTNTYTFGSNAQSTVTTTFLSFSAPKRGSGYSAINYDSANFDQSSIGTTTPSSARSEVHQGVSQIVNKSQ